MGLTSVQSAPSGNVLAREQRLLGNLGELGSALVAFSGGVDSTYLAWAAHRALGPSALAVVGISPSLAAGHLEEARRLAERIGIAFRSLETAEMDNPEYVANGPDRCYHCKSELFQRLGALARQEDWQAVLDGTNADDLADVRPGRRAAGELGVRSPLAEFGLGKQDIRWLSRRAGLETWDRPAQPCLSSRIPHFTPVTAERLAAVGRAEAALRALGFRELRVRHFGPRARVELAEGELARALEQDMAARISADLNAVGFEEVELSREPFVSGRLSREGRGGGDG